ncbi:MAG: hypothetical protein GOMPHAMPRED_004164 [Gomphillus americanus]|uniref:Phosphatidate cytidylyltransferase n=1 Tax=Gomphillus americanus TaxID=1940652 RepID=A0A8H3FL22_9LECA|nr:MAG: hypothetical protein GOMPHAMPRED_004164 [Gomphillus americanus]
MSESHPVPATPQVIAPSPTSSEYGDSNGNPYFPPVTRSSTKKTTSQNPIADEKEQQGNGEIRSRARSRSPNPTGIRRRVTGLPPAKSRQNSVVHKSKPLVQNGHLKDIPDNGLNGNLLSPDSAYFGSSYWRAISRSPSPLGLIPIHRHWRSFVHRHEVPRKALHVSIGFFTLWAYTQGVHTDDIYPWLLAALIPITIVEFVRHRSESFNRTYIKVCGALMRETEVHDKYNGVIFYLAGVWAALRFFPPDVAAMGILLLSWCDTAASTFGRLYGRYTPRIRKGKSLAGSLAALITGVVTAWIWYGYFVPSYFGFEDSFMYQGTFTLPTSIRAALNLSKEAATVKGNIALIFMSAFSGLIASLSELIDVYGLDDNITIPILSACGLWSFLKLCT